MQVETAGADAICVIRNIDSADSVAATSTRLRHAATTIPLAVSGGFHPDNITGILDHQWNILIIGGAFVRSHQPSTVLQALRHNIETHR